MFSDDNEIKLAQICYVLGNCDKVNDNLTLCKTVHTSTIERMVKDGMIDLGDNLDNAPTNGEFLDIAQRYPEITLQCAVMSGNGLEPRVLINGARANGKLSINFIVDFATLMRHADQFQLGTKKVNAQWLANEDN